MTNTGFIMLQRDIINWEWYTNVNTCKLFFHCLLKVNYSKKKWQGLEINKGEFITSYEKLAVETGLTVSKVRTSLSKLIDSNCLIVKTTSNYTKIFIPKLSDFVVETNKLKNDNQNDKPFDKQDSKPLTNSAQTNSNQITTTNTNKINIIIRKKIFRDNVYALSSYNSKILDSFFNYWTELTQDKTEMRFEEQKYFEIEKRLEKWIENEKTISKVLQPKKELITNR